MTRFGTGRPYDAQRRRALKGARAYGSFPRIGSEEPSPLAPAAGRPGWRDRARGLRARARDLLLLVLGALAALVTALLVTTTSTPPALTQKQVERIVEQALASATPKPPVAVAGFEKVAPSVVQIRARSRTGDGDTQRAGGAGVVVDEIGQILTALHVVQGAEEIRVVFFDGSETTARIVGQQPERDIAVLRVTNPNVPLVPAVLGSPSALRVGDEAIAVGNPFGLRHSLSAGSISGLGRSFSPPGRQNPITNLIQFDAAVNPGNSGGPLIDRDGDVVGIVIALVNPTKENFFVGIGFAVPIDLAAGALGTPVD